MQLPSLYQAIAVIATLCLPVTCLPNDHTNDQVNADIQSGTFQNPSANVRPRFRYWIPDASVDLSRVAKDIEDAAVAGAGGVEVLGYYQYGANPGEFAPVDWAQYGWGTPAWKKLFDTLIHAHNEHNLVMDFAMGPNQGQGVPAHENEDGLMWDLNLYQASVPVGGSFDDTIPGWGTGKLQTVITGLVTKAENSSAAEPSLPNNPPSDRLQKTLATSTLEDVTDQVGKDGHLKVDFGSDATGGGLENIVFAVYLVHSNVRNQAGPTQLLGPQTQPQNFIQNGSWTVDHFSARGAKVMTDFWEKYLLVDGTKEALKKVGNYAWEDSVENNPNIHWTRDLPEAFEARRGYSVNKWLPILFHQNSLLEHFSTWFITDEPDAGNSHIADYRTTLTEMYGEYLDALTGWANEVLDIQFSAQVGYNMPVDMESVIPRVNAPETECLAFDNSIDGYRQYAGPANMAGKRVISTECGANFGQSYRQTLPELLFDFKRSLAGSVNNFVIHGYSYSGYYPNTTWPGFTTFTYAVGEMHGRHQPAWDFYSDPLGYVARLQYIFQSGTPKMDLAFYQKLTGYKNTPRSYQPHDLEAAGYSYEYINPDNLQLPEAYVAEGVLAPKRQAYKALVVRGSDSLTVPGAQKIAEFAREGLPIIFYDGMPSYFASYNDSGANYVKKTLNGIQNLQNVHHVAANTLADAVSSLGIEPLTKIQADGTWFTYWRRDDAKSEDYIFLYNDTPWPNPTSAVYTQGTVEFQATGQPYLFDAWTGEQSPILNYTQTKSTTTIFFQLAANQAIIVAFKNKEQPGYHAVSASRQVLAVTGSGKDLEAHVGYTESSCAGRVITSDGKRHRVPPASAKPFELKSWTLTVVHWDPPSDLSNIDPVAVKHNTTHKLDGLTSWQNIDGLQRVSGQGYYQSSFDWEAHESSGAIISFGFIVHTVRVTLNGHTIPPLDISNPTADITKYLVKGTNQIEVVVSTTMANGMTPVWDDLRVSGGPPSGLFGAPTKPSGTDNYGLLNPVVVTPYRVVRLN